MMSKETYVGGNIIETTGGNNLSYAKDIIENIGSQVIQDGKKSGVFYGINGTIPIIEIPLLAKCIVQFRPRNNWGGKFGFDWFRIGDTGLDGDTNYETLIGQYYTKAVTDTTTIRNRNVNSWTTFFQLDPQPTAFINYNRLDNLKRLYGVYSYSLENDTAGNPVSKRYYKPILTIFPKQADPANTRMLIETGEAELKLYLEFEKVNGKTVKPDRVIFEVDNKLCDASHPLISIDKHTILKNNLNNSIDIKLTCNASFTADKEVNVWAVILNESGAERSKLSAGVLRIIAPSKQMIKDIAIVRVRTSAGSGRYAGIREFKRNLRQALIVPNIIEKVQNSSNRMEDILLDVRTSANNYLNIDFNIEFGVTNGNIVREEGSSTNNLNLQNYLKAELNRKYPNQFTNHFKLFFLDNTNDLVRITNSDGSYTESSTLGYSSNSEGTDYGIMFGNHNDSTIGHECLHGLGLAHSFFGNDYIYQALKTDNVMDYSHLERDIVNNQASTKLDRISTWYWQWKKVNTNIT